MNPPIPPASTSRDASPRPFSWIRYSISLLAVAPTVVLPPHVRADLPAGAQVVHGDVSIAQAGARMTINQASRHAIVNWQSFNLGAENALRLQQGGADAAMLARVVGGDPSKLLGTLQADGKLFLINPKGIVVGQGAVIDTAGFMASTLDVSDAEFLTGGAMTFKGDSTAGIVNLGRITAREGHVMLFAHTVKNAGEISATKGGAALAAGSEVFLASPEEATVVVKFNLPKSAATASTGVENSGAIEAAQAELKAAGGSIYDLAINQSGTVRATGVATRNGRVLLTAEGGTVQVSGNVSARNADGAGGEILVGGDYQGKNSAVPNATRTTVTATAQLDASAANATARAGRAIVWADDTTTFLGQLSARGAGGGFAEVSGKRLLDFRPASTLDLGTGGTLLLDPDAIFVGTANPGGGVSFFDVTTLQNQLATTNVVLNSSTSAGDITFGAPLSWSAATSLTAKAGGSINVNASLTASHASSALIFRAGREAQSGIQGNFPLNPRLSSAAGTTITAGTLSYGANADSAVPNYTASPRTASASFDGNLNVGTLEVDLSGGATGVGTFGSNNQLGAFRTVGTGDLNFATVADHGGNLAVKLNSANSSAPQVQITTPGTLTLESGSSFNFASQANLILASTGGAFVNQAGATPFGANTRALIYTSTPAATTRGGLAPTYVFNKSFDAANPLGGFDGDTTSRLIYSGSKATVTLTADNQSRVYGDNNATPTFTANGLVDGDTFATSGITGAPSLAHAATKLSNVGSHAITAATGTIAGSSFYNVAVAPGSLAITPAPLTIAVDSKSRTYGDANPALTATVTGLKNDESAASAGTLSLATSATQSSNAGAYAITGSLGSANPNYTATISPGTLTIDKAPLTVSVSNSISKAQGAANPDFTAFTSAAGLKLTDTLAVAVPNLAYNTTATTSSPDGTYAVTPTGTSINYALTFNPGLLTISTVILPALTYRANDATRVYGDANPAFGFTRTGLVSGTPDDVTGAPAITSTATQSSGVGSYTIGISQGTLASSNYRFSFVPGSLSITPAPLAVAIHSTSRVYGDANPSFTSSVTGLKNSDSPQVAGSVNYSTAAGLTSNVGGYAINGTTSGTSANYTTTVMPGTLTINPAPLTATINNASRAPNTANPSFSANYSGFKNGETASVISGLAFSTTATPASPSGAYPITGSGTAANYALTFVPGTLTIGSTLHYAATSFSRLYGDANPASLPYTVTGLLAGDTLATVTTGAPALTTTATQSSGVGGYTIAIAQGTLASPSYAFSFTPGTLSVTPAPLTITANNASRSLNHANPAFTASYTGFKNSDTSAVVSGLQFATTATLASPTGSYPITLSGATAANYAITYVPGTLSIGGLAALTIAANNASKTYGQANPAFTASYSGLVNGDTASVVSGLQFSTTATQASGVGSYAITPFGASAAGYSISYVPGTLIIDRATLFVAPQAASRVYGDANPGFGATFSGLVNGDTSSVVSGLAFNTSATPASNVGLYAITLSGGTAANYNVVAGGTAQLTVNPAPLTVKFDDKTRVYGDANPALTFSVSGLKNSDTADSAVRVSGVTTTAAVTDGIGDYGINGLVLPASSNYDVKGVGGTLRIAPRPLTISADRKTKVYGDANPALTATFSGLASFDTAAVIPGVALRTEATQASGVSDFGILVSSGLNRNYAIDYKFGTLSITPATLSLLAPPDLSRIYGQADPTLPELNFGGLKNGDSLASLRARYLDVPAPTADVGTYTYRVAIDNSNYRLAGPATASFRVDPAPLDVQIGAFGRLYGDANPTSHSLTAAGLAFGQSANSVLQVNNPTDARTPVGVYSLLAQTTSPNYYVRSTTGGRLQINPRVVSLEIGNVAKYYAEPVPNFTATVGGDGLAPFDTDIALLTGFRTAMPVTAGSDVGLYRIDPILAANPNYRVRISSGYLAILQRPVEVIARNAVHFGNDAVPADFDPAALGLDLVSFRNGAPTGFSAIVTGLPPGVSVAEAFPNLTFNLSATNTPSPIGTVVTDLSTVFPSRPGLSDAVTPGAALPTLPAATLTMTPSQVRTPTIAPPTDAETITIGEKTFVDSTRYIVPSLGNGNYVITKITNGILTSKPDPTVLQTLRDVQTFKVAVEEANRRFYLTDVTDPTVRGAFGFTKELFPFLRDLLLQMLEKDPALQIEIFGSSRWAELSSYQREGLMAVWLSDLHENPVKQGRMLPQLVNFAMLAAAQPPEANSKNQKLVLEAMKPFLVQAEKDFSKQLEAEKEAWKQKQLSAEGVGNFMLGTDMYEEVMGNAIGKLSKDALTKMGDAVEAMVEKGAVLAATGATARTATIIGVVENIDRINPDELKSLKFLRDQFGDAADKVDSGLARALREAAEQPEAKRLIQEAGEKAAKDFVFEPNDSQKAEIKRLTSVEKDSSAAQDAYNQANKKAFNETLDAQMDTVRKGTEKVYRETVEANVEKLGKEAAEELAREKSEKFFADASADARLAANKAGSEAGNKAQTEVAEKVAREVVETDAKKLVVLKAESKVKAEIRSELTDQVYEKVAKELLEEGPEKLADPTYFSKMGQELGAEFAEKSTKKLGSEIVEVGAEKVAKEIGEKIATEIAETAAEKLAARVAVKVGAAATKFASWAKSAIFGPAALVELAVDLAVSSAMTGIERAVQEGEINKVIASTATGSTGNNPHEMVKTELGQATMMMALVNMMSSSISTAPTLTQSAPVAATPVP